MESMTITATKGLFALDKTFVGTDDYIGLAYFWSAQYKFWLREASLAKRRRVHHKLLKAGLQLDGHGPEHSKIISNVLKVEIKKV